jgi:hypothetical protein
MRTLLEQFWSDWRIGLAVAALLAAVAGLISAWLTPRGPVTTPQALTSMLTALLVGLGAGLVMGSRWSMLVTPAVFVGVFEVAQLGVDGPTVDGIQLGSTYGIIAFVVGRLFHGVLVLLPRSWAPSAGSGSRPAWGESRQSSWEPSAGRSPASSPWH